MSGIRGTKVCVRCGQVGQWRAEFCQDCRDVEQASSWAQWAAQTCPAGHRWDENGNLRFVRGVRRCRACDEEAAADRKKGKVAA